MNYRSSSALDEFTTSGESTVITTDAERLELAVQLLSVAHDVLESVQFLKNRDKLIDTCERVHTEVGVVHEILSNNEETT
jgi:hypothetical protein